jgi:hypothetical protein
MPMTLGGHPKDEANLSPELRRRAAGLAEDKDTDERRLGTSNGPVCSKPPTMTLREAQTKLIGDWLLPGLAYKKWVGPKPPMRAPTLVREA